MSKRITWNCETCNLPMKDGKGYISASTTEAREAEQDEATPAPVHWRVECTGCDPWASDFDYAIDVERIRTIEDVLSWTAHLMEKPWVAHTDWTSIVRRFTNEGGNNG